MKSARGLVMGPAPYVFSRQSTATWTWGTALALVPAFIWGLYCFGAGAALPVVASVLAALVGEAGVGLFRKRITLGDGSAALTGFLVGLAMPPSIPLYIPAASALFAIIMIKGIFGGIGSNWMNPALGGIVFALLNWPRQMGEWVVPRHLAGVVGVSGATPLGFVRDRLGAAPAGSDPLSLLAAAGMKFSDLDRSIREALNFLLFSRIGADLPAGYIDLLIGNRPGALGEISGILILAASVFLLSRRIIRWEIPASVMFSYALIVWVFGGLPYGNGFFAGDVLFAILSGSFLIVTFFMAPDPVTSPSTRTGMLAYGFGIAVLTFLIRSYGAMSEGTAFAVLTMNCLVPLITGGRAARPARLGRD
ncbi:MAG TPA: RnfABCDGE type electron transport complex subunit D [Rectinemataceae bacterium]|nr:RnfABCDGE type electron transport complex subunit D [Rectinemataceae bacterium]